MIKRLDELESHGASDIKQQFMQHSGQSMATSICCLGHNFESPDFCQYIIETLKQRNSKEDSIFFFSSHGQQIHKDAHNDCMICRKIIVGKISEYLAKQSGGLVRVDDVDTGSFVGCMRVIKPNGRR